MAIVAEVVVDLAVLALLAILTAGSVHRASGEKACSGHGSSQAMAAEPAQRP